MKPPSFSSAVVVGTARNLEKILTSSIPIILKSFSDFKSVKFHVVESNSNDKTLQTLKKLCKEYDCLSFETIREEYGEVYVRTKSLSLARNQGQQFALNQNKIDYVVVADLDRINCELTRESVLSNWKLGYWDMVAANQPNRYYDLWALRHPYLCPNDCWKEFEVLSLIMSKKRAFEVAIARRNFTIAPHANPISVESAFGGIAIYKAEAYAHSVYRGFGEDGQPICEHVPFNLDLHQKGKILLINPRFVNTSSSFNALNHAQKIKHNIVKKYKINNPREIK